MEYIKGRACIRLSDDIVQLAPVSIEKPKTGETVYGVMEVKGMFDLFHSFLRLPEDYTIIGVYFDAVFYMWSIIVESDAIALPPPNEMIPTIWPSYQRTEDGKVRLLGLEGAKGR